MGEDAEDQSPGVDLFKRERCRFWFGAQRLAFDNPGVVRASLGEQLAVSPVSDLGRMAADGPMLPGASVAFGDHSVIVMF